MAELDEVEKLRVKLENTYRRLADYRSKLSWRFFQGSLGEAYSKDFDDSSWKTVSLPFQWDPSKGDVWLRCKIVIPDEIEGVKVSGSKVELYSSAMITGGEVFVDSKLVLKEDYWTDFRGPRITITEKARPGDTHVVAIHAFEKRPFARGEKKGVPLFHIGYYAVDDAAFEIETFIQELNFTRILPGGLETLRKVVDDFDYSVFSRDVESILMEIEKARQKLRAVSKHAKEFKVHLVAHAHIDMNWLWPWEDTVKVIERDFSTMLSLMDKYPEFHFSQSQAVTYRTMEEKNPALFEKIRQKIHSGNWDVTASMWVEADLNMIGEETLARQILYSKRYVKEKLGFETRVGWEPDTFGHIWTLPQVFKKAGVDYYYFMRCGRGYPMFWWEGPDGSRLLAFNSVYNNTVTPRNIVETARLFYEKYGLKTSMFVYGVGDHGGGATLEDINSALKMRDKPAMPDVVFSSTHRFFNEVSSENPELPVVRDELNFTFDGCYTTHADIKRYNRLCERYLVDAEKLSAVSGLSAGEKLKEAWEKTLFNQFHDILDGSAFHESYSYSGRLAEEALAAAKEVLEQSIREIAGRIGFSQEGLAIIVFNTLAWDRKDVARVKIPREMVPRNPVVKDRHGKQHPAQIDGDELVFIADVPSLGYSTYYLAEGHEGKRNQAEGGEMVLENEFFKVEVDRDSGAISSVYDKTGRFVAKAFRNEATRPEFSNLFQVFHEAPHGMSAWIIGPITRVENLITGAEVKPVEKGPVVSRISTARRYRDSTITQEIVLYTGIPRIDFKTTIEWREVSDAFTDAPMLKVSFSPVLGSSVATFEIPFGSISRTADGREFPALRWIDLSDGEYGVSLLNDCKYGFDVCGNTMRMTVLRTSYSPDPTPDQGRHELKYSLYPHAGDWRKALAFRKGYELNHPFETVAVPSRISQGDLQEEASFLRIKPENIVLSCLKLAEDSDDIIIRIYDATGEGGEAEITPGFPVAEAVETDLLERDLSKINIQNGALKVKMNPWEITTIRLKKLRKSAFSCS
ncbi:MAG: glycoside hydrolase family 38 C-terminal domain-containing protein [Thermoproteota archaeon]